MNKKERFEVRLTPIEKRIIENRASKSGLNPSEYIRSSALDKVIKTSLSEEELVILNSLFEVGNELKKIRTNDLTVLNEEINKIIEDLKNIIRKFYDR